MSLASYQAAPPRNVKIPLPMSFWNENLEFFLYLFLAGGHEHRIIRVMAHKKAGGSTQNGRDSVAKRRGVKRFGGEVVRAGEIIVRQKGFKFRPGMNTHLGSDWTIHANINGTVTFATKRREKFSGKPCRCTVVSVKPV